MASKAKHIRALTWVIVSILTTQLAFLPVSFALKIRVGMNMKLREYDDHRMERIGLVKKGSIVHIPDRYVEMVDGKPNLELTLNKWLREAGQLRVAKDAGIYDYDGGKSEYFFPVTVTSPAKGSTVAKGHQDKQHFIALRFLMQRGAAMIVSDDTIAEEVPEEAPRKSSVAAKSKRRPTPSIKVSDDDSMEASSPCLQGLCSQPSDISEPVRNLIGAISPALAKSQEKSVTIFKSTQGNLNAIYKTFRNTCGFPLEEFMPILKSRASQAGVPAEILMALMTQESSGRCFIRNSEADSSQSVGLFQIKSHKGTYPRCTSAQLSVLASLGRASLLATGPRCLENPLLNLDEAIKVLRESKRVVMSGSNGFDPNQMSSDDQWRLAVSGYNGGPKWVLKAKSDLEAFNARMGTKLNPHNWEDLRLFYMRSWLSRDSRAVAFGTSNSGRSQFNSISNLSYAENIMGRPVTASVRPALASAWVATVKATVKD